RTVPATGWAAAFSALILAAALSAAAFFAESVGGGGPPKILRSAVSGLLSRLKLKPADMAMRYGLNIAVSLVVLPRKSEYVLEKSNPGRRSERTEYPHESDVNPAVRQCVRPRRSASCARAKS